MTTATFTAARDAWESGHVLDIDGVTHRLEEPGIAACGPIAELASSSQAVDCHACLTPRDTLEQTMSTTTSYGTWANHGTGELTLEESVAQALGEFAGDFDVEGLCDAYREKINAVLPAGVSLHGAEFYGPVPVVATGEEIREAVHSVDFWSLTEAHSR